MSDTDTAAPAPAMTAEERAVIRERLRQADEGLDAIFYEGTRGGLDQRLITAGLFLEQDVPDLLAALEAAEAENKRLKAELSVTHRLFPSEGATPGEWGEAVRGMYVNLIRSWPLERINELGRRLDLVPISRAEMTEDRAETAEAMLADMSQMRREERGRADKAIDLLKRIANCHRGRLVRSGTMHFCALHDLDGPDDGASCTCDEPSTFKEEFVCDPGCPACAWEKERDALLKGEG